jgi:1-acyl-sn-glycerol-3-phosphate acyltransferase
MDHGRQGEVEGLEHIRAGNHGFVAITLATWTPRWFFAVPSSFFREERTIPIRRSAGTWRAGHVSVPLDDVRGRYPDAAALAIGAAAHAHLSGGGRSELREFKDGAAFIAIRARVLIVLMALIDAPDRCAPLRFHRGRVKLRIGQPIETQGLTIKQREALTAQARAQVVEMLGRS